MRYRKRLKKSKSQRIFRKGSKVKGKNRANPMRGGIRM